VQCIVSPPLCRKIRSAFFHEYPLSKAISDLKFRRMIVLARPLARLFARVESLGLRFSDYDLILPVPLHVARLRKRGFNQALSLIWELAKIRRISYDPYILARIKDTPPQVGLGKAEREKNLEGAMKVVVPEKVVKKSILLIDDVTTTGSTLNACATALLSGGATFVDGACLAYADLLSDKPAAAGI